MDICYDPTKINIIEQTTLPQEKAKHHATGMRTIYPDVIDLKPANMPPPRVKIVQFNDFVDANLD